MNFSTIKQMAADKLQAAPPSEKAAEVLNKTMEQVRGHYKPGEYNKQPEIPEPCLPKTSVAYHSQNYCQSKGWNRCNGVFEAIERRKKGERYLSYREADIAARNDLLGKKIVVDQLMCEFEFMIHEDIAGVDCSIYELRRRYNVLLAELRGHQQTHKRGLDYKKNLYDKQPQEQKDKCDSFMIGIEAKMKFVKDEMQDIEHHLAEIGLKMWPEEFEYGFHPNLTRPEYMSEEQYQTKLKSFEVLLVDPKEAMVK